MDTSSLARGLDLVRKMDCGLGNPPHVKVQQAYNISSCHSVSLVVMDCGSPGYPENGDSNFDATTYGSLTTHSCDEGYSLEGDKIRTCYGNGTWSGESPKCKREWYKKMKPV